MYRVWPVVDDDGSGRNLVGEDDAERIEVEPAESESKRWRDKAIAMVGHRASREWQVGADLDHCCDDAIHQNGHQAVGEEQDARTSYRQSLAGSNKETRSNAAADSDHLSMARLDVPLRAGLLNKLSVTKDAAFDF